MDNGLKGLSLLFSGVAPLLYILAGSGHLNVKLNDTH